MLIIFLLLEDEGDEEEAEAYILKDISKEEDEEAVYEMVVEDSGNRLHRKSIFWTVRGHRYFKIGYLLEG